MFLDSTGPVNGSFRLYLFESTGGAAQLLAERTTTDPRFQRCHRAEREWLRDMPAADAETPSRRDTRARPFVPYPLIMQWLARKIGARGDTEMSH